MKRPPALVASGHIGFSLNTSLEAAMDIKDLDKRNKEALETYCDVLLALRDMRDTENLKKSKKELSPKNSVLNRIIDSAIRKATDSAHPFGYSDSGKETAQYISIAALDQRNNGNADGLICEHIIPISILKKHIVSNWANWDRNSLRDCFLEFSATAVITKEEDDRLKAQGLLKDMPPNCTINDKFSRYAHAKIEYLPRSRGESKPGT